MALLDFNCFFAHPVEAQVQQTPLMCTRENSAHCISTGPLKVDTCTEGIFMPELLSARLALSERQRDAEHRSSETEGMSI